ncbi:DegT/DnrJ/EryC1/StrS family aminotransferase [Candidatus Entotheonella palauensis]|nr:DegT/DnrJ/EryC1/StrS family aminotransferase [Candidatus Entotheonella palauensis]
MTEWRVPLADVTIGSEELSAVSDVLRSGWLSMGPVTEAFETHFAASLGVKHAIAVTNGTAALHLAHTVLGAGPGDAVICPSLTFVATANAIRYTGARPVFADIASTGDLNISAAAIAAKIDASTKGICVVHYGGHPCDMTAIMQLAQAHGLYVVEDAAHAPGAACHMPGLREYGRDDSAALYPCGTIGDVGCFSFFANKNMTTGEGGMVTTNDDALAARLRRLRSHGMTSLTWDRHHGHSASYDVVDWGYNYRIDELRSALGLAQLQRLQADNRKRAEIAHAYTAQLQHLSAFELPFHPSPTAPPSRSSFHLYPVLLKDASTRAQFRSFMHRQGVQTSIHYPAIHRFSRYQEIAAEVHLPLTDEVAQRVVTLPLYAGMQPEQHADVLQAIHQWHALRAA